MLLHHLFLSCNLGLRTRAGLSSSSHAAKKASMSTQSHVRVRSALARSVATLESMALHQNQLVAGAFADRQCFLAWRSRRRGNLVNTWPWARQVHACAQRRHLGAPGLLCKYECQRPFNSFTTSSAQTCRITYNQRRLSRHSMMSLHLPALIIW